MEGSRIISHRGLNSDLVVREKNRTGHRTNAFSILIGNFLINFFLSNKKNLGWLDLLVKFTRFKLQMDLNTRTLGLPWQEILVH